MKRIKMVERGGTTLKDILSRTNPWSDEGCERQDCLPCRGERGRGGNCQRENVVYRITCQECGMRQVKAEYTGETSRTAYLRGREHWEGLESQKEKNALWKHCVEKHGGTKVNFSMKVLRSHKTPLSRQVHESVEIDSSKADIVMNSKGEWNGSRIPRIIIEVGEELQEDEEDSMAGTNTKIRAGPISRSGESWRINNTKKRKSNDESSPGTKRRRVNGSEIDRTEDNQDNPECSQAQSKMKEYETMSKMKKTSTKKERQEKECKESKLMKRWLTRNEKAECGKAQSTKFR